MEYYDLRQEDVERYEDRVLAGPIGDLYNLLDRRGVVALDTLVAEAAEALFNQETVRGN